MILLSGFSDSGNNVYLFTIVIGALIFLAVHLINRRIDAAKGAIRESGARITAKEEKTAADGTKTYEAEFTLIDGTKVRLPVSHRVYRELPEEGYGNLAWRTGYFRSFMVKGRTITS